jgi:hypothetical protein
MARKSKCGSRKCKSPREKALFKAKEELDLITADVNQKKSDAEKAEQTKQEKEIELEKAEEAQTQNQAIYQDKLNFEIRLKNEIKIKSDAAKDAADQLRQAQDARNAIPADEAILQCHSPYHAVIACRQQNQEKQNRNEQKRQQRHQADQNINSKQNTKKNADIQVSNAIADAEYAEIVLVGNAKIAADSATSTKNTALEEFNKAKKLHENTQLVLTVADGKKTQVESSFTLAQKEFQQEIDLLFGDSGEEDITMHYNSGDKVDPTQETIIENTPETAKCAGDHIDKYEDYPIYHMNN